MNTGCGKLFPRKEKGVGKRQRKFREERKKSVLCFRKRERERERERERGVM